MSRINTNEIYNFSKSAVKIASKATKEIALLSLQTAFATAGGVISGSGIYAFVKTFEKYATTPEAYAYSALTIPIGLGIAALAIKPKKVIAFLDKVL
jgi:hypothetical protein